MEDRMDTANVNHGSQQIGTAQVAYGTVQAHLADNGVRAIETNSPVFLGDRITTDADGTITILFDDEAGTRLELGRMADVLLDEDVFQATAPEDIGDIAAAVEQVREVLETGGFNPAITAAVGEFGDDDVVLFDGDASIGYSADIHVEGTTPDIDTLIPPPEDV
jgi:hypothetical protein